MLAQKEKLTTKRHLDRRGIAFEDRRLLVPARVADWPKYPPRIKADKDESQSVFHLEFANTPCWICGSIKPQPSWRPHQLHHLAAGMKGRSHERELFTYLCCDCHEGIGPEYLGKLLFMKWCFDDAWCDWELLTIRHGFHLPDMEVPRWYRELV